MADNLTNSSIISTQNKSQINEVSQNNNDQIYQDSLTEKICYTSVILIFCSWIYASNSMLIAVLLKYRVTTKPNRTIRIILALIDMLMASHASCTLIPLLFMDSLFNLQVCSVVSDIAQATLHLTFMVTATLAVERYIYLIKPLEYHLVLKPKYLTGFLLTYFTLLLLYFLINGHIKGHQYKFTELSCLPKRPNNLHLALRILIIILLPAIIILFVLIKTKGLHSSQMTQQQQVENITKKSFKSFKLILLVSSSFIISIFPLYILRVTIVRITEKATDIVILMRLSIITLLVVSSALNPLIQLIVDKDLFVGVLKLIGKKADFSWQREMKMAVNMRKIQPNNGNK